VIGRQTGVELLARQLHAVEIVLAVNIDDHGHDGDAQPLHNVGREVARGVGDDFDHRDDDTRCDGIMRMTSHEEDGDGSETESKTRST
jgi:hypothetical protein